MGWSGDDRGRPGVGPPVNRELTESESAPGGARTRSRLACGDVFLSIQKPEAYRTGCVRLRAAVQGACGGQSDLELPTSTPSDSAAVSFCVCSVLLFFVLGARRGPSGRSRGYGHANNRRPAPAQTRVACVRIEPETPAGLRFDSARDSAPSSHPQHISGTLSCLLPPKSRHERDAVPRRHRGRAGAGAGWTAAAAQPRVPSGDSSVAVAAHLLGERRRAYAGGVTATSRLLTPGASAGRRLPHAARVRAADRGGGRAPVAGASYRQGERGGVLVANELYLLPGPRGPSHPVRQAHGPAERQAAGAL